MQELELKACPFCGGQGSLGQSVMGGKWLDHVECLGCGAMSLSCHSISEAVQAWNRRENNTIKQFYHEMKSHADNGHKSLSVGYILHEMERMINE
jgi:Lar family restriction alleviation protein